MDGDGVSRGFLPLATAAKRKFSAGSSALGHGTLMYGGLLTNMMVLVVSAEPITKGKDPVPRSGLRFSI